MGEVLGVTTALRMVSVYNLNFFVDKTFELRCTN